MEEVRIPDEAAAAALPVTSLHGASGAFAWAPVALRRLVAYDCLPREALKNALSNRTLTTSSAFSGIGSDAAADACIAAAARDVLHELGHNQQPPLRFISLYNIEIVGTCRNEVLSGPDPPRCMFGDILEFAPPKLRGLCMRAMADAKHQNGQDTIHMEQLREALPKAVPKLTGYCFVHDRVCRLRRAYRHVAGTPCVDHSRFGPRKRSSGPTEVLFLLWVSIRRALQDYIVIHENVPQFGKESLEEHLGDLYYIVRLHDIHPHLFGWPQRRDRQLCVLVLREWANSFLPAPDTGMLRDHFAFEQHFKLMELVAFMGFRLIIIRRIIIMVMIIIIIIVTIMIMIITIRHCDITWRSFLVSPRSDLEKEWQWSASRPGVQKRRRETDNFNDDENSFKYMLTTVERERLVTYSAKYPGCVFDLGQNPESHAMVSDKKRLHCLIKGTGLLFIAEKDRWMTPTEVLTAMGWPIVEGSRSAACNAVTIFAADRPAPPARSHSSMVSQAGNAIHIGVLGVVQLALLIKLPSLAGNTGADTSAESASAFSMGFERMLRRKMSPL